MDNSEKFIQEVKRRFLTLFNASKGGYKLPDVERHRFTGFIHAGVFMEITSNKEMHDLMEAAHYSVFGKTIKERKETQKISWEDHDINYDQYEQPTYERITRK